MLRAETREMDVVHLFSAPAVRAPSVRASRAAVRMGTGARNGKLAAEAMILRVYPELRRKRANRAATTHAQ
jgi:hypothetical protein